MVSQDCRILYKLHIALFWIVYPINPVMQAGLLISIVVRPFDVRIMPSSVIYPEIIALKSATGFPDACLPA